MKKVTHIILLWSLFFPLYICGMQLKPVGLDVIKNSVLPTSPVQIKFFTGDDSVQKEKMLETLKIEYKAYCDKIKQLVESFDKQMHGLKKEIDYVKSILLHNGHVTAAHDFYSKKLTILNKKYQILPDIREVRQQIAEYMKQHIEYLDTYFQLQDPIDHIEDKTLYTFFDPLK